MNSYLGGLDLLRRRLRRGPEQPYLFVVSTHVGLLSEGEKERRSNLMRRRRRREEHRAGSGSWKKNLSGIIAGRMNFLASILRNLDSKLSCLSKNSLTSKTILVVLAI